MQHDKHPSTLSNAATRIAAGDDRTSYDRISIALHWLTVVLVLAQFALSQVWGFFPRPTRHVLIVTHMSFGILLTAVIVMRIVWRLSPGHQAPVASSGWVELAAKAVHYLLYVLLAAEAVLGFVLRWSGNEAMSFFGLLIAPPFAPFSKAAHHTIGEAHEFIGWAIIVLAAAHAAAAMFHHFVVRDAVLTRMLPGLKRR
ncbi:cytochrome b [Caballeronia concitans]|uniref:Cytochrome B561 n=1 Tax=Caballeronia concitans TaxID=1777133 RepID=A0A658QUP6_9BURK|nr:cytochrome b [Caballeronia concitans]KIG07616.1 Di-heme cytochrome, transmembrane [Burkholderia sp. MR1]SAL23589.1 cytochrome B561 [Caballeronia concitans]